jgi:acetyl-CoA synthetase
MDSPRGAEDEPGSPGDTSTLADTAVVDDLVEHRQNEKDTAA